MTLQELQLELTQCGSLAKCDAFLLAHLHEIRPLFYGLTRIELREGGHYIDYENVFLALTNSPTGAALRSGEKAPPAVIALLIFFLSLFERSKLYATILAVAELIPTGPLKKQVEALFEYKNIQDSRTDYLSRFERILFLLQGAWSESDETGRRLSEDLLQEYMLDAMLEPLVAGIDIRPIITDILRSPASQQRFTILNQPALQALPSINPAHLLRFRNRIRSRIVESFHALACALTPDSLLTRLADEFVGEAAPIPQAHQALPDVLNDQLHRMGAVYSPQRQGARLNFDADAARNRIYLGTYFPKTVIESWNIFTELLTIPVIQAAYRQKEVIRLLDVGSGTGAAVIGTLLALSGWDKCDAVVEVTSLDINLDALSKQGEILDSLRPHLPFDLHVDLRHVQLPFDLDGFVPAFTEIGHQEGPTYDLITCWKCLCEFYNVNFASAQGIIRSTLDIATLMLLPYGLCVVADVTSTDNNYEYFAITLNREANAHDTAPNAAARTVLPLPCGRNDAGCTERACYTQRRFAVSHQLAEHDESKIAYRVLAPASFAASIKASFSDAPSYRVNAARPTEACSYGRKIQDVGEVPNGYTDFFTRGG